MTLHRLRSWFRTLAIVLFAVAGARVAALSAQSTGKIEGHVKDTSGQAIVRATVVITGTAYSAQTDAHGYYFIQNIPAGVVQVEARFINFKPRAIAGLRVPAGQTVTGLDFVLENSPVQLRVIEVTVSSATNLLVPHDVVSTKHTLFGEAVRSLPVDRIQQAMALEPGVTQIGTCGSNLPCTPLLSVRGGRVDQNATYIDGVPVQNGIHTGMGTVNGGSIVAGAPQLALATNGLEEANVTTGGSSAVFGNAQAGVFNISTRGGGNKFSGNLGYETGLLGLGYYGQGLNTLKASIGGPIGKRLTYFLSTSLEGNNSVNGGNHAWLFPKYAPVAVDTAFTVAAASKAGLTGAPSDSVKVNVYDYAVVEGGCGNTASQGGFLGANDSRMAANYGAGCTANQLYTPPNTNYFTSDKLQYSFGQGSRLSLSYNFSGNQNLQGGGNNGFRKDGATLGNATSSNVATLNWNQTLIKSADHQVSIDAYLSRQWNNSVTAPLTSASETSVRGSSPAGFILRPLTFSVNPSDYPVDSQLIYHILTNNQLHRIGIQDPKNTGQYNGVANFTANAPPDGVGSAAGGGGATDIGLAYNHENRWVGIVNLDVQADQYNRIKLGGQLTHYDILNYNSGSGGGGGAGTFPITYENGHLSGGGHPIQYAAYAEDRLDLGDVVLVTGARYDYYWTKAWRWNAYPEISSRPGFLNEATNSPDSLFCPVGTTPSPTAKCGLVQDPAHHYLSPHVQVSFPVNDKTNFRLSYAQNVQAPDFALAYQASLFDINVSGQNQRGRWGGDLDFGKTITFEFGARHAFSDDMVLDVAVYNNDIVANPSYGFQHPIDPLTGSAQILYLVSNSDFGNTRGIDVRLDRRIGAYFNGSLTYSFQDSKNTGGDPTSYLGFFEPIGGFMGDPPTAALPTALSRPHSLTALFNVQLPADWEKGTILGSLLNRTGFFVTARVASGAPYTRCDPSDAGSIGVLNGQPCGSLGAVQGFNTSRLPMAKQFDMRMTKDFRIGKYGVTGFLDARNVLNLQNITSVYSQTGTTSSGKVTDQRWSNDSSVFSSYAKSVAELRNTDLAIVLPTSIAGCAKLIAGVNSAAPQCFYYIRSEQRFGNGDGVYTLAEQRAASDAKNAAANSVWARNTGARTVRFGMEVNF